MTNGHRLGLFVLLVTACLGGCAGPSAGGDSTGTPQQADSPVCPAGDDGCATSASGPVASAAPATPAAPICPVGAPTDDGACEVSYDVSAADFVGADGQCGGQIHNLCQGTAISFHWKDAGGRAPISVKIALRTSVYCADDASDRVQQLSLNGEANVFGSYAGRLADCVCPAIATDRTFDLSVDALTAYAPGDRNMVTIAGPNRCLGMDASAAWAGAYARVTVRY